MKYRRIVAFTIALILGAGCLAACSDKGGSEGDSGSDSVATDADTEVETQIDTVIDTETNDGTDTEADTESEPESESESESEAESESESETETESESETESEEEKREEELTPQLFKLTSDTQGVKVLGVRNLASENGLHMDWTCSGAEFGIDLKGGSIRLSFTVSDSCYFRIWVDGVEYKQNGSPYFTVLKSNPTINLTDIPVGRHTVKVMKVTGYTLAQAELTGVIFAGSMLTDAVDTSDKDLYIEFVGDSITCGWGTIGEHGGAYTDQDGTLAYPYLVAQALNADYSMTALSGQGLLCGDPGVTNGYLYADPRGNSDI